jgi:hypothetical protein
MKDNLQDLATIVTLSDGETWDVASNAITVKFLTWEGEGCLFDGGSIESVEREHIVTEITLKDLIRCWLERDT